MLIINTRDPNALCRHCRAGSPHSLSIHAKTLLAIDQLPEVIEDEAPIVIPRAAPRIPRAPVRELLEVY